MLLVLQVATQVIYKVASILTCDNIDAEAMLPWGRVTNCKSVTLIPSQGSELTVIFLRNIFNEHCHQNLLQLLPTYKNTFVCKLQQSTEFSSSEIRLGLPPWKWISVSPKVDRDRILDHTEIWSVQFFNSLIYYMLF